MKSCDSGKSTSPDSVPPARRWLEPRSVLVGGVAAAAVGLVFNELGRGHRGRPAAVHPALHDHDGLDDVEYAADRYR